MSSVHTHARTHTHTCTCKCVYLHAGMRSRASALGISSRTQVHQAQHCSRAHSPPPRLRLSSSSRRLKWQALMPLQRLVQVAKRMSPTWMVAAAHLCRYMNARASPHSCRCIYCICVYVSSCRCVRVRVCVCVCTLFASSHLCR